MFLHSAQRVGFATRSARDGSLTDERFIRNHYQTSHTLR